VYQNIALSGRPFPLFQHLRRFDYYGYGKECASHLALFLGRGLSRFSIESIIPKMVPALSSLPTLVPLLSELSLGRILMESKNDSTVICNTVCDAVCTLQFLRLLELHIPLRAKLLYHISIMPHLSKLVVMITAKILTQALLANSSARLFPALHELVLYAAVWAEPSDFLEGFMRAAPLRKTTIAVTEAPLSHHLQRLFTICAYHSLTSIVLSTRGHALADDERRHVLDPGVLGLLFACPDLEVLEITTAISFEEVDDTVIRNMASAWPRLKSLALRNWKVTSPPTKVTLVGLLPLADCIFLKSVSINVDATVPNPNVYLRPDGTFYNGALTHLSVNHSLIEEPIDVALFLSNVFPNLAKIEPCGDWNCEDMDLSCELWREVEKFYEPFVSIRRQERAHAVAARRLSNEWYVTFNLYSSYIAQRVLRHA
jgi:hypothetical protein